MMEKILLIIVMLFALNVEAFARGHVAIFLSALTTDSLSVHKEKALDSVTVVGTRRKSHRFHEGSYGCLETGDGISRVIGIVIFLSDSPHLINAVKLRKLLAP